jgi:hypothetical protein
MNGLPKDIRTYLVNTFCDVSDRLCLRATCTTWRLSIPMLTPKEKQGVLERCFLDNFSKNRIVYMTQSCRYHYEYVTHALGIIEMAKEKDDPDMLFCLLDCLVSIDCDDVINFVFMTRRAYDMIRIMTQLLPFMKRSLQSRVSFLIRITVYTPQYIEWALDNCILSHHHVIHIDFADIFTRSCRYNRGAHKGFPTLVKLMMDRNFDLRPLQLALLDDCNDDGDEDDDEKMVAYFEDITLAL